MFGLELIHLVSLLLFDPATFNKGEVSAVPSTPAAPLAQDASRISYANGLVAMQKSDFNVKEEIFKPFIDVIDKFGDIPSQAMALAQAAHETEGFTKLEDKEEGKCNYKSSNFPSLCFHGRGYFQLRGVKFYTKVSLGLKMDSELIANPDLIVEPMTAQKVAVWQWNNSIAKGKKTFTKFIDLTRAIQGRVQPTSWSAKNRYRIYKNICEVVGIAKIAEK